METRNVEFQLRLRADFATFSFSVISLSVILTMGQLPAGPLWV